VHGFGHEYVPDAEFHVVTKSTFFPPSMSNYSNRPTPPLFRTSRHPCLEQNGVGMYLPLEVLLRHSRAFNSGEGALFRMIRLVSRQ
jgi:hypothetical protein